MARADASHLLFSDDLSGYANEAAVASAYPSAYGGSAYDASSTEWGLTFGPDGQAGVRDQTSGASRDSGAIDKDFLAPHGRWFRARARYNMAATNHVVSSHTFMQLTYENTVEGESVVYVGLARTHASGNLVITVHTQPPDGNASSGFSYTSTVSGALPTGTPVTVEIWGRFSQVTGTLGAHTATNDGEVHVLLDDVEVFSYTGHIWQASQSSSIGTWPVPSWNAFRIPSTIGAVSNIEIWDEQSDIPDDGSSVCSCNGVDPKVPPTGGGIGNGGKPVQTGSIGTVIGCIGGGLVPEQDDVIPSELWWAA